MTGKFTDFKIEVHLDEKDLTKSSVSAAIRATSVNTGIAARDEDLRGPKFFDVANHPEITFQSTVIRKKGKQYVALGNLTIRGVTKPVELPFTIQGLQWEEQHRPRLAASIRLTVNRLDYGVGADWRHTAIPNFLGNEVAVEIDFWTRLGTKVETPPKP